MELRFDYEQARKENPRLKVTFSDACESYSLSRCGFLCGLTTSPPPRSAYVFLPYLSAVSTIPVWVFWTVSQLRTFGFTGKNYLQGFYHTIDGGTCGDLFCLLR